MTFEFINNFFIFLISGFLKKTVSFYYFFITYYNFLFVEEIVNLVITNYFLIFVGTFFKLFDLNFLETNFLYVDINYYWLAASLYIVYRFFLRNLSFYGASSRRESFFIYQNWFKNYKDKSSRELQVTSRITALTTNEFNDLFKRDSYTDIDEYGYADPQLLYHNPYYKDTYKAVYYYFLQQNEIKLLKNANDIRRLTYYKDRYGPDVFSYLISREDDKMVKPSSSKSSIENLSQADAKSHI
jgi:hypothetical protein